jgi:hypothetical protein
MCEPATMLAAASLAVGTVGTIKQGQAAKQAAGLQAELYRREAEREKQIGALNAKRVRDEGESLSATQRALLGASGGAAGTGSALLIQEDLAQETEFNARLAENNAAAAISSKNAQIVLARAEGRSAQTASYFRAGSTLLKGAKAFI